MKKSLFLYLNSLLLLWSHPLPGTVASEFKTLQAYGDTLYNLIAKYVQEHSTDNGDNVTTFIYSDDTKTIFGDALKAGYDRKMVIFQCYQAAFTVTEPNDAIINGLHGALARENKVNDAVTYGTFTTMGVSFLMILYQIRSAWVYYKYDNPLLMSMRGGRPIGTYSNTNGPFGVTANTRQGTPTEPLLVPSGQPFQ